MKNFEFKKLIPHAVAVGIFLLVTLIFCKPALESGVVLKQSDISSWEGMAHQSYDYKEKNGHFPLWVSSMFSGMPSYQIAMDGHWSPIGYVDKLFQLWLPKPFNFFFLACICFYFLCICIKIRPYAAILGALGFAFCTYSPIIITAGHDTKMLALAYVPAIIGSVFLILDKKYLVGFTLAVLFTALQIGHGHQQISYYAFIIIAIMILFFVIDAFKNKTSNGIFKSIGLVAIAGLFGIAVDAITIFPTYDYAKYSKRGGQLKMDETKNDKLTNGKTTGLSKEYAFQWSYGKAETMSLIFPGVKGYGMYYAQREGENYLYPQLKDNANVVNYMMETFPQAPADQIAQQMSQSLYWGDQPFTNGPVYLGAGICFLFILGIFYLDNKHKWWIASASFIAILMALGSNFDSFNTFLFNYVPLYNKFRVPTMALVIPQLLFPLMAALVLNKLVDNNDEQAWKKIKLGLMATAAVFVLGLGYYFTADFGNENKARTSAFNNLWNSKDANFQSKYASLNENFKGQKDNQLYENWVLQLQENKEGANIARGIVTAVKKDRATLLIVDIVRSFLIILLVAVFVIAFLKKKLSAMAMLVGITIIASIDLLVMGSHYLNEKSFDLKDNYTASEFPMTDADRTILADKDPNYRVFNTTVGSPFEESKTSYYHKSIGGYHAAKMGIYDDLSTYQMNGSPNPAVLNMLNAKWIITEQDKKPIAFQNPEALGNSWFIKGINFVKGPVAEMKGLTNLNTKDSIVVDETYKAMITEFVAADSTSIIKQTKFDNEAITYESNSKSNNIAVFSEIFYKDWDAYIDGKPASHFKANYVLRAMVVPAGKHTIEFKFEPKVYMLSKNVSGVASWILFGLILATLFIYWKKNK